MFFFLRRIMAFLVLTIIHTFTKKSCSMKRIDRTIESSFERVLDDRSKAKPRIYDRRGITFVHPFVMFQCYYLSDRGNVTFAFYLIFTLWSLINVAETRRGQLGPSLRREEATKLDNDEVRRDEMKSIRQEFRVKSPRKVLADILHRGQYFQDIFAEHSEPLKIQFGHVCENPHEWEQRFERRDLKNNKHQGKVRWGNNNEEYGEHYWDFNHR